MSQFDLKSSYSHKSLVHSAL